MNDNELFDKIRNDAKNVDLLNPDEAKKWFEEHACLSVVDASWIFGISTDAIRSIRSKNNYKLTNNVNLIHHTKYYYTPNVVNKCRSYFWLHYNYVRLGYSVHKMAKLANVSSETMHRWLAGYKIPMRDARSILKIKFDEHKSSLVDEVPSISTEKSRNRKKTKNKKE